MITATFEVTEEIKDEFYWKEAFCGNCHLKMALAFKKRIQIHEHLCPNCGCKSLGIDFDSSSKRPLLGAVLGGFRR